MTQTELIASGSANFMKTYAQFPVVLERGEGRYLYDVEGNRYLDMVGGIATNLLGYNHAGFQKRLVEVLNGGLYHTSNLYWNKWAISAAKRLTELSGLKRLFFCNSGTEANEAAIKLARKYGNGRTEIIAMEHSFHGRTIGSLSATGQPKYQEPFKPMLPGFTFVPYNDSEAVTKAVGDNTCAIIVEAIQGEGGVHSATLPFLLHLEKVAKERDLLLIVDEVQCGMGRTGEVFAYQKAGITPDIITLAKGLGGGIPIGAMVVGQKASETFVPGDHGATFGGNLLSGAAADYILSLLQEGSLLTHVKEVSSYMREKLEVLKRESSKIVEIRGEGLLLALQLSQPVRPLITELLHKGVLFVNAGENVLRMVPPLTITTEEIDEALELLKEVLCSQ